VYFLTLSYSSEGSPAILTSLTQNCLKLIIPGFPYKLLPVSCGDNGFSKQSLGQVLEIRPQSASTAVRALLHFANYSILTSDLVEYDNLLQIVLAVWRTFFKKFEVRQTALTCTVSSGLPHPIQQVQIKK
jgi:hypothetical protein